ncbi:MAG: ABC transporter substrate-binding protein [Haloplanus sp.]
MNGPDSSLRRRTVLGGLGAGVASLAGCASIAGDGSGSRLRVGTIQPPVTLDPIVATDVGSQQAIARVFDGLYTYGADTDVVPQLAAGAPTVEDDRTVTVELDADATFQNGRPVRPADVRYSFVAPQREDAPTQWAVRPVDGVDVVDDRTVRFHLAHPYPELDDALTRPIVPERVRETDRERFARRPVGSGPYRVRSFSEEQSVELVRWDDYWGDPTPAIDRVSFAYVESPITQLTSLVSGRTDAIEPISPRFRDQIRHLTGASVAERDGFRSLYFGFNMNEGPTTDRAVREGVARCFDLDRAVSEFVAPVGDRQYSLVPRRVADEWRFPVEAWKSVAPSADVEAARRWFDRADAHVGRLTILTSKDPVWKELADALAAGLRDAGQSALVDAVGWGTYQDRHVTGAADDYAVFVGEVAGNGDPDSFLYPVFHENAQGATNGIFYNEESVMNRLLAARRTTDRARRRTLYVSAVTKLLEERVHLPISSFYNSFAHHPAVRGFRVHPIAGLNPRVTSPAGVMRVEGR